MRKLFCKAGKKVNKKGFTLVELLVCVAIMSVIALLISQFIASTTGAYRRIYSQTKIQETCQDSLNQISNIVRNSKSLTITKNGADGTIKMESLNDEDKKIILKYIPDANGNGCIYVDYDYNATVDAENAGKDEFDEISYPDIAETTSGEEYNSFLLTDMVKEFKVDLATYKTQETIDGKVVESDVIQDRTLDMVLTLSRNDKEFTQNYKASLRNTDSDGLSTKLTIQIVE